LRGTDQEEIVMRAQASKGSGRHPKGGCVRQEKRQKGHSKRNCSRHRIMKDRGAAEEVNQLGTKKTFVGMWSKM
jgi:hypothetical protein